MNPMGAQVITADNRDLRGIVGDHVITDPPYDQHTSENARSSARVGRYISFDGVEPAELTPVLLAACRRWSIAFCALEQLGDYARAAGPAWVRAGIWHRTYSMPQLSGDRPAQAAEGIAIMHPPGRKRWNGNGWAHWAYPSAKVNAEGREIDHPTPKPLALMLELVELFTDPGDLVVDPFCGSGTTGVACVRLGRRFVGIEIDPTWADLARERIAAEAAGLSLSAARARQLPLFGG